MKLQQSPNTQVMIGENTTGIKTVQEHPTTVVEDQWGCCNFLSHQLRVHFVFFLGVISAVNTAHM